MTDFARTLAHWRKGVRLYIALAIVLITVQVWWWAAVSYPGSILFATRLTEAYAWLSVIFLGSALLIGPLYKILPKLYGKKIFFDARRLLGVGAAWFASLHVLVAYSSLFKWANPLSLPNSYQGSFALGLGALIILLAMAFTSFDRAFSRLGVWWFRLHRLVYVAVGLTLFHAFIIGVHATQGTVLLILTIAVGVLLGMHLYILAYLRKSRLGLLQVILLTVTVASFVAVLNYGYHQKALHPPARPAAQDPFHEDTYK